jgi:copper chaperone
MRRFVMRAGFAAMLYSVSKAHLADHPPEPPMLTLSIPAISCGHCVRAITDAIHELDPAASVRVDIAARTAVVDTSADSAAVRDKLAEEGYPSL